MVEPGKTNYVLHMKYYTQKGGYNLTLNWVRVCYKKILLNWGRGTRSFSRKIVFGRWGLNVIVTLKQARRDEAIGLKDLNPTPHKP